MEVPYWMEPCEHGVRTEYCEREMDEAVDDIEMLAEMIESAVSSVEQVSINYNYHGSKDESSLHRTFEFDEAITDEAQILGVRRTVVIDIVTQHHPARREYTVATEWRLAAEDHARSVPFVRLYMVKKYPEGHAQCTVTEPTEAFGADEKMNYEDRPMVPYDMHELFSTLENLHELQRADANYVDKDSYRDDDKL